MLKLDFIKPNWDHLPPLPKKPRIPPSFFSLKARRLWLNLNPEFKYGDHRDKVQRQNSIRAKRTLDHDEAWALRAAKRREREEAKESRRLAKENKGLAAVVGELPKKALARATSFRSLKSSPSMSVKTSPAPAKYSPVPPAKVMGIRLDTSQKSLRPPGVGSSRTVYAVPSPVRLTGRGGHTKPGMPARPRQVPVYRSRAAPAPVAPKPASKPPTTKPPVTRSASQPMPRPTVKPVVKVTPSARAPTRAQTTPVITTRRKP